MDPLLALPPQLSVPSSASINAEIQLCVPQATPQASLDLQMKMCAMQNLLGLIHLGDYVAQEGTL